MFQSSTMANKPNIFDSACSDHSQHLESHTNVFSDVKIDPSSLSPQLQSLNRKNHEIGKWMGLDPAIIAAPPMIKSSDDRSEIDSNHLHVCLGADAVYNVSDELKWKNSVAATPSFKASHEKALQWIVSTEKFKDALFEQNNIAESAKRSSSKNDSTAQWVESTQQFKDEIFLEEQLETIYPPGFNMAPLSSQDHSSRLNDAAHHSMENFTIKSHVVAFVAALEGWRVRRANRLLQKHQNIPDISSNSFRFGISYIKDVGLTSRHLTLVDFTDNRSVMIVVDGSTHIITGDLSSSLPYNYIKIDGTPIVARFVKKIEKCVVVEYDRATFKFEVTCPAFQAFGHRNDAVKVEQECEPNGKGDAVNFE